MKTILTGCLSVLAFLCSFANDQNSKKVNHAYYMPAPTPYGSIYNQSAWSHTNDFITNGNTSAALSGNFVNISCATTYNWNNTVHITGYRTKLEKWRFRLRFKLLAWAADSYGIGIGLKSANEYVPNDVFGFIQTANHGAGGLYIVKSNQQILSTGATGLGVALNDVIELEAEFRDSVFSFRAHNLTTGSMAGTQFTYASNGSTAVVPNTCYFSILELGGTHQLQGIEINSEEKAGANIVTIGDSKTIGYFSNHFAGRYAAQLNRAYPDAVINAGGGDRITHVLSRRTELERLAARKYLLSIGSNDLRFGGTLAELQLHYDSLVRILQATGAEVFHIVLPEDHTKNGAVNLLGFKDWVASSYPGQYINVWDSLSVGNLLKGIYDTGDGIHLNQAANDKIYEAILASQKLTGAGTLPVSLLSFNLRKEAAKRTIAEWKTDPSDPVDHFELMKSTDGRYFSSLAYILPRANGEYVFTDSQVVSGTIFYQLKITEYSGAVHYSKIISITDKAHPVVLTGWKPVNGEFPEIILEARDKTRVQWKVVDLNGRVLATGGQQVQPGINHLRLTSPFPRNNLFYFSLFSETGRGLGSLSFIL